ncbi:hypothetical protein DICVIV_07140 [Dictyocaulus viviparus]|uniref:Protein-lysine N-methyltransferase n=1 Tax=Dictyocaulus viviparus TaxID=29172 RepID=A0A0D8XST8_DICVI|nr:hypothetical protein DICVIV_07140 [Dictyocaulus viviparus]
MTDSDEETPRLPADTLEILHHFIEQRKKIEECTEIENWQLSQFWYSTETALTLCKEINHIAGSDGRIALISCPTLMSYLPKMNVGNSFKTIVNLFEYDQRFAKKFPVEYVAYDYRHPLTIPDEFKAFFDVIVADPPFLSVECLEKTSQTIHLIKKHDAKIILCTGLNMENLASWWFIGSPSFEI